MGKLFDFKDFSLPKMNGFTWVGGLLALGSAVCLFLSDQKKTDQEISQNNLLTDKETGES